MGASFVTKRLPGNLTATEVKARFGQLQDQDRYENGHSYSGGIGMARGIDFPFRSFPDVHSAVEWLEENAVKWQAALAVRAGTGLDAHWVIGAICAC